MRLSRRSIAAVAGAAAIVALAPVADAATAPAQTLTVGGALDTTYTQVTQDGDNSVKTTLATCPALCEGNPRGERDAFVEFRVAGLPAGAVVTSAQLEAYTWTAAAAKVTAYSASGGGGAGNPGTWASRPAIGPALASVASVASGYNSWDVTPAVRGNGAVTLALLQEAGNTRSYWASVENPNTAIRPRLVIMYQAGGGGPTWNLVWSDEFDGTALDPAKWNARNNTYVDYDLACITSRQPQNISVAGGVLTLWARKEAYTCGSQTRGYTVPYLDTAGHAELTYGRFEVRAKSPNGPANSKGLWPAAWMRPKDGGNGEIDIVELPGGASYYQASTHAIFRDYTPTKQDFRYTWPTGYPGDGWHTYAIEWDANEIRWYLDDTLVWTRNTGTTGWFAEVFRKPYHLRLNFQVGGWLGNPDASTAFPAAFQVDYVRVYQRTS